MWYSVESYSYSIRRFLWLAWLGESQGRNLGWWRSPVQAPRPPWQSPHSDFETGLDLRSHRQHRWRRLLWMQVHIGHGPEPLGSERWARGCTHSHAQSPRPVKTHTQNFTHTYTHRDTGKLSLKKYWFIYHSVFKEFCFNTLNVLNQDIHIARRNLCIFIKVNSSSINLLLYLSAAQRKHYYLKPRRTSQSYSKLNKSKVGSWICMDSVTFYRHSDRQSNNHVAEKQHVVFSSGRGMQCSPLCAVLNLSPKETRFTGRVLLCFQYGPDLAHREMSQLIHCVTNETFSMMMHWEQLLCDNIAIKKKPVWACIDC